jgi:hypothetical protein
MVKFLTKDEVLNILEDQRRKNVMWLLQMLTNEYIRHIKDTRTTEFTYTLPEGVPQIEITMLIEMIEEKKEFWADQLDEKTLNIKPRS